MLRLHRILVPFDMSAAATQALDEALRLAHRTGAELHIVQVELVYGESISTEADQVLDAEVMRDRMKRLAGQDGGPSSGIEPANIRIHRGVERDFAAAPAIVRYANEHDIDLITMGTHGRRGVSRLLLGSVAEDVVRHAHCPVLTVHAHEDGVAETPPFRSILVPVDFSEHARAALACAHEWATLFDAHLDLVHVIEDYVHPSFYASKRISVHDAEPNLEDRVRAHLEQFNREVGGREAEVRFHVLKGRAAAEIMDFARDNGNDLIVMSTHGLTGMERFVMGGVAEKVIRQAGCPVLTVRAFGKSLMAEELGTIAEAHP